MSPCSKSGVLPKAKYFTPFSMNTPQSEQFFCFGAMPILVSQSLIEKSHFAKFLAILRICMASL